MTYNHLLVLLSYLIAAFGSYAFLQFANRIIELGAAAVQFGWLAGGALAMGGGVWTMHFIGMLAYRLPIPVSYDIRVTLLSAVPAILAAGVALHVVARAEISTGRMLVGGALMGAGIGAMHYTGMAALRLDALVRYDPVLFGTSVVTAVVLAILALQVRFFLGKTRFIRNKELFGALVMGLAVTVMHYTAMASTYCFAGNDQSRGGFALDPTVLAIATAFIAFLVLTMAIVAVIFDRRVSLETTMRRDAVDSHKQTSEQLFQAQKMEAVGQLTGGVAHDFNNILMIIMANVDTLEEESLSPLVLERIKEIGNAAERAATLTRQLLAFSRKQALRPQRTNINDLVATTGNLLRRTLGEHIEINFILADDLWTVEVDRAQLESALVNLGINARDAMPQGGSLLIETLNTALDEEYVARNPDASVGSYVMLAVTDTGRGIPADLVSKVFEPFFTTKAVGKGTGLGLSMVYGFIRQSRGHVCIYSEVGRGTTVKLYLPRIDGEGEQAAPAQSALALGENERILVVEDDEQVRAGIVHQLRSLHYVIAEAPDGAAGLAAFETASQPYALLLTDVIMPGPMNGKALADEVVRRWPKTKVVFMSGYSENAIVHQGRLDAGVLLLSKPFRKGDLAQIIRQALDSARSPGH